MQSYRGHAAGECAVRERGHAVTFDVQFPAFFFCLSYIEAAQNHPAYIGSSLPAKRPQMKQRIQRYPIASELASFFFLLLMMLVTGFVGGQFAGNATERINHELMTLAMWRWLIIVVPFGLAHYDSSAVAGTLFNGLSGGVILGYIYLKYMTLSHYRAMLGTWLLHATANACVFLT